MADAPTHTLYNVKNVQQGPRGIWSDGLLSYIDAGASVAATLTDEDKKLADATGYFEIGKPTAADKKAADDKPA